MINEVRIADHTWVREHNQALVLNHIWETQAPISRAQLSQQTGLNKGTVSSLIQKLLDQNLVREIGLSESGSGRPAMLLTINPEAGCVVGLEIATNRISIILTDFLSHIIWRHREAIPGSESLTDLLERIYRMAEMAIAQAGNKGCRVLGIGIGTPGLTDRETGTLFQAPSSSNWHNVPLKSLFEDRFNLPVIVDNEANMAALGEQFLGSARGVANVIYISANIGLGTGLIIDGKLFGGRNGFAGEAGHMTVDPYGPLCACGNRGCWATLIGPVAIIERMKALEAAKNGTSDQTKIDSDTIEGQFEQIVDLAAQGNSTALQALSTVGRWVGIGIASLVNIFNPDMVVLGGILSQGGHYLVETAQLELQQRALGPLSVNLPIQLSAFKLDSCLIGCVSAILQQVLANPTNLAVLGQS